MNSRTTQQFWKCYSILPVSIKKHAKTVYKLFISNPYHPGLHFKRVHSNRPIYSIRITKRYRALGIYDHDEIIWFWIGSHIEYEKMLKRVGEV